MVRDRATGPRRAGVVAGLLLACAAASLAAATATTTSPAPPPSIQDSPGYYPVVDPESASVALGRRANAPLTNARFKGGCRSLEELGRAVVWTLHHQDADSLRRLCVDRREFSEIMWREFPESRPATGLTADDAWQVIERRFLAGVSGAMDEYAGRSLVFRRVEVYDTTRAYKNFRLHNGLAIVAADERGREERLLFVRAAVERKGRFKIQSTAD